MTITTTRIGGALGAEVTGVDLSQPLNPAIRDEIYAALLEHLVLYFRDQPLTHEQHTALGAAFGTLNIHPFHKAIPDYEYVLEILKEPGDPLNIGGYWHSDVTFLEEPVMGSILYAAELPPAGGDTIFANTYLTYEALSPGLQAMLEPMMAMHSARRGFGEAGLKRGLRGISNEVEDTRVYAEVEHPVVRTHPETGRKILFVNPYFTIRFADMEEAESRPLLDYLCRLTESPEYTFRLRWEKHTVAFLDNRCTQHFAVNDYPGQRRRLYRVAINGERPI